MRQPRCRPGAREGQALRVRSPRTLSSRPTPPVICLAGGPGGQRFVVVREWLAVVVFVFPADGFFQERLLDES